MSITSIDLPAKDGWEWREVGGREYADHSGPKSLVTDFPGARTRFFIQAEIEPEWVSIPEGTLCEFFLRGFEYSPRVGYRTGDSFADMRDSSQGKWQPDAIAFVRPLRALGKDEVAVKKINEPRTGWAVTAANMGAKGYDDISELCYAYADALEKGQA